MTIQPFRIVTALLLIITISGCQKTLDFRNSEISNGKIYERNANEPFTGKVTNLPLSKLSTEELSKFVALFKAVRPGDVVIQLLAVDGVASLNNHVDGRILCDTLIEKGIPTGDANCKVPGTDAPFLKVPFKQGQLNGKFVIYDPKNQGSEIAQASLLNNQLDGKSTIMNSKDGSLLLLMEWKDGRRNGIEEEYYASNGKLKIKTTYSNGSLHGDYFAFAEDGKSFIEQRHFINGNQDGEFLRYSNDGKILLQRAHFINDKQDGKSEEFDPISGKLFRVTHWKEGVRVGNVEEFGTTASQFSQSTTDECVNLWTEAFRKEAGNDVLISTDQISEWETACKGGKKPN